MGRGAEHIKWPINLEVCVHLCFLHYIDLCNMWLGHLFYFASSLFLFLKLLHSP